MIPSQRQPADTGRAPVAEAADLEMLLAAVAWRLQTGATDVTASAHAQRALARECARDLLRLGRDAAALRRALKLARDQERRACRDAEHDSLTELPNRRRFDLQLQQALARRTSEQRTLAVLFLDLDDFKRVNDLHGHAVGDELLRIVARRLRGALRSSDMVCRLGGDEFACLVSGAPGRPELKRLAGALITAVSAPLQLGELQLSVRPSVGIAICPDDGVDAEALLQRADAAMFRAKRQRRGVAFFEPHTDLPAPSLEPVKAA
ncbi:diguanylate cyclase (GGDEF)-like protein [Rubrivivax gelatinosus]|uniref:GGDEF domain-containing protein n=1 Tax=Rubrivivax gelatinosus TaxID=28068 RepID=UPI0018CA22AE|nr:GGDEF domain-containing protein [Rubrivivax gelatinosus]MBG6079043.1 diguanylate cyclase (GGDEF)-like protein [Rubrivivax gelatinosus]